MITTLEIRRANEGDLPAILGLFDLAVEWLVARGLGGQWGTRPLSENARMIEQFLDWIRLGTFFVAVRENAVVGTIVLSPEPPPYAAGVCQRHVRQAIYLEAFVTDRRFAGQGVGAHLLAFGGERAGRQGLNWLQLDCWAGNEALRCYYRRAGFQECEVFQVGDWQGVLFEKPLNQNKAVPDSSGAKR